MQQRDLLKEQIEQLSKVLAQVLASFLGLASSSTINQAILISNKSLTDKAGIDIETLIYYNKTRLKTELSQLNFTDTHFELLADYLTTVGKSSSNNTLANQYFQTALALLDITDELSATMSFERINKMNTIRALLH